MCEKRIKSITNMVNQQKGCPHRCSNQIVTNILYVKNFDMYFEIWFKWFIRKTNAEIISYSRHRTRFILNGEHWVVIRPSDSTRGYRAYKAIIDSRILDEDCIKFVSPYLHYYCCEVAFF